MATCIEDFSPTPFVVIYGFSVLIITLYDFEIELGNQKPNCSLNDFIWS